MHRAGILGVGALIPEKVVKNNFWDEIELFNLPPNGRSPFEGIEERRFFDENILPSDAGTEAARLAIKNSGIDADDIDLVMVQSMIQDEILPGNASKVQHKLGLKNAGAWNVDSCCSSFVTMVVIASNLIATGEFRNILIAVSAFNSQLSDFSDYLCINLGDAAGAVVMGRVPEGRGYIASACTSDGSYHDAFILTERLPYNVQKRNHFKPSPSKPLLTTNAQKIREMGRDSVKNMSYVLNKVMSKANIKGEDINLFLSHQPCYWAHDAWRNSVGIPETNSYQTFRKYGNIASASIPVNLFEAWQKGMLKDGYNLLIASSGAGENHIAALLKWYSA